MEPDRSAWRVDEDGLLLKLKAFPKAKRDSIDGLVGDVDGGIRLRVKVTAPPESGQANAAIAALLAKCLGLPKSALEVQNGQASRLKTLRIRCDRPQEISLALSSLTST